MRVRNKIHNRRGDSYDDDDGDDDDDDDDDGGGDDNNNDDVSRVDFDIDIDIDRVCIALNDIQFGTI